ncbi:DUF7284 family protein [Haloarcula salinisoli]|uniref:Uncharacterized protein n=1 Tax=Haloarcula salinisoli TaxID=2487746 RepID=A0A8J8C9C9_9EURY|nr:hypothetical protein [Halomicroarcula salinisoli]MBX0305202.1 hypothetical protein [Halomicroarcula salinisoli]
MRPQNRAVSTSIDVIIAMLVLSAGITMIFLYQNSSPEQPPDTEEPDEIATLLSTTTVEINYTVRVSLGNKRPNVYRFTETGTLAYHLKRAALLNATIRANPNQQRLSYLPPCITVVKDYQGAVKEDDRFARSSNPGQTANDRRYPDSYYTSDYRLEEEHRIYRFTGLKDEFYNFSGRVPVLKKSKVNSSDRLQQQYLNSDGKPAREHMRKLNRSQTNSIKCNPTGAVAEDLLDQHYNPVDESKLRVGDSSLQLVRTNYDEKIQAKIDETLRQGTDNYQIQANWQPYARPDGARPYISGSVGIGEKPPRNADVSTATLVMPSGMATAEEVRNRTYTGGLSESIGAAIVEGYFPSAESKYEFDRGKPSQTYREDLYMRLILLTGAGTSPGLAYRVYARLSTSDSPDTGELNTILTDVFKQKIFVRDIYGTDESAIRSSISTGKVDIVVTTW